MKSKKKTLSVKYGNGGPINPPSSRDSMNLYNFFKMQDKLMGSGAHNLIPDVSGFTMDEVRKGREDKFIPSLGYSVSSDYKSENDFRKNISYHDNPEANLKLVDYYNSLKWDEQPQMMYHTSPDVVHPSIKPLGTYFDGTADSPYYNWSNQNSTPNNKPIITYDYISNEPSWVSNLRASQPGNNYPNEFEVTKEQALEFFKNDRTISNIPNIGTNIKGFKVNAEKESLVWTPIYEKQYTPNMDTDLSAYLKSQGKGFSYSDRKKLAKEYGIKDYKGTAKQNLELLKRYKQGKPVEETKTENTPTTKTTPKTNTTETNIKEVKKKKPSPLDGYKDDDYVTVQTGEPGSTLTQIQKVKVSDLKKWKGDYQIVDKFDLGGAVEGAEGTQADGTASIPYNMIADTLNYGIESFAQDKNINGVSIDTGLEATAKGTLKGAAKGAAIGSVVPVIGTAIGAGIGALVGGTASFVNNKKQQKELETSLNDVTGNINSNPYGTITMEDGGLTLNNPLINIELGELMVDRNTGDIIEDYSKERGFKPHSKTKEDMRNFVPAQENGVVIPKKYAKSYRENTKLRQGILRDVINKQADRELYGVDADGNKVEYSQIEKDYQKMEFGGDPELEAMSQVLTQRNSNLPWVSRVLNNSDLRIDNKDGTHSTHRLAYSTDDKGGAIVYPTIIERDGALVQLGDDEAYNYAMKNKTGMQVPNVKLAEYYSKNGLIKHKNGGFAKKYNYGGFAKKYNLGGPIDPPKFNPNDPFSMDYYFNSPPTSVGDLVTMDPMGYQGSLETGKLTKLDDLVTVNPKGNLKDVLSVREPYAPAYAYKGHQYSDKVNPDADLWTVGNTLGAIGTGISALGPLAVTLANGIDKNENNYYSGVSTRAEGNVADMFRGVERRGARDLALRDNMAQNLNRNRTTNFGSMLANAQNTTRGTQRNMADFFNQIGAERARIMADLNFRGDMANAQGLTARDERLDQNRDNFYSNLANNISNAGVNIQGFGRNMNTHEQNKAKYNSLAEMFADYGLDPEELGKFLYKGNKEGK